MADTPEINQTVNVAQKNGDAELILMLEQKERQIASLQTYVQTAQLKEDERQERMKNLPSWIQAGAAAFVFVVAFGGFCYSLNMNMQRVGDKVDNVTFAQTALSQTVNTLTPRVQELESANKAWDDLKKQRETQITDLQSQSRTQEAELAELRIGITRIETKLDEIKVGQVPKK